MARRGIAILDIIGVEEDVENRFRGCSCAFLLALALVATGCSASKEATKSEGKAGGAASAAAAASKWEKQLVRRPGNSLEDGKIYIVQDGKKHWVVNGEWITLHGYKWPGDVKVIPAEELDAIPTDDPIR